MSLQLVYVDQSQNSKVKGGKFKKFQGVKSICEIEKKLFAFHSNYSLPQLRKFIIFDQNLGEPMAWF